MPNRNPDSAELRPAPSSKGWPARALGAVAWCVGLSVALRALAILLIDGERNEIALDMVLWRAEPEIARMLAQALLTGGAAGLAIATVAGLQAWSAILRAGLTFLLGLAAMVAAVVGAPLASAMFSYELGVLADPRLAGPAIGAAALLAWLWSARSTIGFVCAPLTSLVVLALGAAAPVWISMSADSAQPTRTVRLEVRDLLLNSEDWEVLESNPNDPPVAAALTPNSNYQFDGGDRPSLLMPPPAKVRFQIRAQDGPCVLRPAFGIDQMYPRSGGRRLTKSKIGAEVTVGDKVVWSQEIQVSADDPPASKVWRPIEPENGIRLAPGDVVTLRTWLIEPGNFTPKKKGRIPVGFSGLTLERSQIVPHGRPSPEEPNVVLIVMDTLRADRLSCYGWPTPTTPTLDALAARGVLYERAYSVSSWTWPSTASILTGLYPESHGVINDDACYLSPSLETLPELLNSRGYVSAAFSGNPLITEEKNFGQGLETFDSKIAFRKTSDLLPAMEDWLENNGLYRFFLYLHLVDPHAPHEPNERSLSMLEGDAPKDYPGPNGIAEYHHKLHQARGRNPTRVVEVDEVIPAEHQEWMKQLYTASVATSDDYVADVLDMLERHGVLENTVVIFTSDHGEELLEHGFATHGQGLWESLMHIPLIIAGPGVRQGVRVEQRVSNRHIAPTVAKLGGAKFRDLEGAVDLLDIDALPDEPLFFSTLHGWWNGRNLIPIYAMRVGDWVLHYAPTAKPQGRWKDPTAPVGDTRLFNLRNDPEEKNDLSASEPERVERMRQALLAHLKRAEAQRPSFRMAAGSSTLNMLKEIGYIGEDDEPEPGVAPTEVDPDDAPADDDPDEELDGQD